ncbi:MAG: pilus assembly protein [Rhodopila sp.]|nr:pilus assembly protein [Rhodopila sp.]
MNRMARQSLARSIKGAAALEFALVSGVLMAMLLGGFELGLMMWTRGTLQAVAAQTARCVAIGSSACTTSKSPQQYAVDLATTKLGSAMITKANVTVTAATTCKSASGSFEVVTISASPWVGSIVYPFTGPTQTLTACYPH